MTDFLRYLAAVWCFLLGGYMAGLTKWLIDNADNDEDVRYAALSMFLGSVFLALGWWLA